MYNDSLNRYVSDYNSKLEAFTKAVDSRIENLEQYSRRNSLLIYGIPENTHENTDELVTKLAHDKLSITISAQSICRSHRLGRRINDNGTRPRPILVKFIAYNYKRAMFMNKRKLKGTNFVIREHLTRDRIKIINELAAKFDRSNVWTVDGRIYYKDANCNSSGGRPTVISSLADYHRLNVSN